MSRKGGTGGGRWGGGGWGEAGGGTQVGGGRWGEVGVFIHLVKNCMSLAMNSLWSKPGGPSLLL